MTKGASVRRPRRLRFVLFALGGVLILAGALVLALPVQAWEGGELDHSVNCDKGVVYFIGKNFPDQPVSGRIHIEYPPSEDEFFVPWHWNPKGAKEQVIGTMTVDQMSKQAGRKPPFDVWDSLEEDNEIMDDWTLQPCGGVTPTPSGGVSPSATPSHSPTPTPTAHTPTPEGSVLPTQAQTSPSPSGGVLAESVGLPNTGVPHSTLMTLGGTLIAIGLMLLALSAMMWRRPITGRRQ